MATGLAPDAEPVVVAVVAVAPASGGLAPSAPAEVPAEVAADVPAEVSAEVPSEVFAAFAAGPWPDGASAPRPDPPLAELEHPARKTVATANPSDIFAFTCPPRDIKIQRG
ncbi:hypothetical protein GCM10009839_29550 [Catenulispora yoronensis]|uniref:Uncharacterized protein n=1 Tax=Catenulispora yoronensis TaxID=450799 RepID=A0ABN2U4I5_9ACTN